MFSFLTAQHKAKTLPAPAWGSCIWAPRGTWTTVGGIHWLLGCRLPRWDGQETVGVASTAGQTQHLTTREDGPPFEAPCSTHRLWEEAGTTCSHGGPALGTPSLWVALA